MAEISDTQKQPSYSFPPDGLPSLPMCSNTGSVCFLLIRLLANRLLKSLPIFAAVPFWGPTLPLLSCNQIYFNGAQF